MSAIQAELVEASGFEPTKNYARQDYLAALARSINEIEDDDFDALSVEAQDWFNNAVKALNKKQDLPEFPDAEEAEDDDTGDNTDTDSAGDTSGDDTGADESEEETPPKKEAKGKKPPLEKKVVAPYDEPEDEYDKTAKKALAKVAKEKKAKADARENKNRYGITMGSQNNTAIEMFEKGSRMSAVTEEIGGTYYNLLKKLSKDGHKVEKAPTGIITVTHKDDLGAKKKVKK